MNIFLCESGGGGRGLEKEAPVYCKTGSWRAIVVKMPGTINNNPFETISTRALKGQSIDIGENNPFETIRTRALKGQSIDNGETKFSVHKKRNEILKPKATIAFKKTCSRNKRNKQQVRATLTYIRRRKEKNQFMRIFKHKFLLKYNNCVTLFSPNFIPFCFCLLYLLYCHLL